ncbi:tyrosine-type recombinase/integrase [Amycolatopsis cynarae]|uniref:Tyrosine-type recombinase/integrase n=1 Tax=Amycolatopsis cynarae TaxID=2995223 RepID=A0ABY7B4G4_9PSEU|nr:tyrosine-type recombinase/integrase [Amycolatopsis sp. HUAS 11-8]WAL67210.1 tyrosine-type recombinase/integrase [Amycolatopsis sp. HUAS 11-8]
MAQPKIKPIRVGDRTRYRWVCDIGTDPKTGKRKQITRTFDRRKDAEADLAKTLHDVGRGAFAAPTKTTVNEFLDTWVRSATRGKAANTVANCTNALKPARERFGHLPLQKLTTVHVEDLVDWMLTSGRKRGGQPGTGLSPRSVQLTLSRLKSALDSAVHRRLVEFNVAAPVKCPTQAKTKREPWTPEEVKSFLASLAGHRLQAVLLLSLIGLRPAEVCGLRWSDIDLAAGTIAVGDNTRTIVWGEGGGKVEEKGAKTEAGKRKLPLPAPVSAALLAFQTLQADEKQAAEEAYTESGYVLVDELGRPCRTDWLRRRAYKLMDAAKVRRVRLYDARHACLTYLRMSGVPGPIVSAWAGHADLSMADRVYVHPNTEDLQQGRDVLAKLLG